MDDRVEQDSHAWAEVYIENLGWVGFDVANGISPDERYVRIATGLDYKDAAPVFGMRYGDGEEACQLICRYNSNELLRRNSAQQGPRLHV